MAIEIVDLLSYKMVDLSIVFCLFTRGTTCEAHWREATTPGMRELGATVVPVKSGSRTLKDAVNEARSAGDDADAMTIPWPYGETLKIT